MVNTKNDEKEIAERISKIQKLCKYEYITNEELSIEKQKERISLAMNILGIIKRGNPDITKRIADEAYDLLDSKFTELDEIQNKI